MNFLFFVESIRTVPWFEDDFFRSIWYDLACFGSRFAAFSFIWFQLLLNFWISFVVCLGVAGVVVGGGFRSRQGGGCRGRRGWLWWSPGVAFVVVEGVAFVVLGRVLATQPATHRNACRISTGPKKTPKSKKNRGFFGKGFLFSVVISPLKKSPPLF